MCFGAASLSDGIQTLFFSVRQIPVTPTHLPSSQSARGAGLLGQGKGAPCSLELQELLSPLNTG